MTDFTIAIPTYNGAPRLPSLLARLQEQANVENLAWEILIVDNNSSDETQQVIRDYQTHWTHPFALRYCFEGEQGAAFARQRAITEAKGQWVGFLDDDILPATNWISEAWAFKEAKPEMAVYGGQIHGEFEVPPPENFQRIQSFLAIRERGEKPHLYEPERLILPPSAAWVVRRQAWLENVPQRPSLSGRIKGSMVQGDDYEPLLYMHKAGWEIWYNPAMHVLHKIPAQRLEKDYLISLARGCGLCICKLRLVKAKSWQKPWIKIKIFLGNLRRLILHWLRYRERLKTDFVAACEYEFLKGSLLSPFFAFNQSDRNLELG